MNGLFYEVDIPKNALNIGTKKKAPHKDHPSSALFARNSCPCSRPDMQRHDRKIDLFPIDFQFNKDTRRLRQVGSILTGRGA